MAKSGAKEAAPTKGRRSPGGKTYQKYQPHYAEVARLMCRRGAIDTELACMFGVDVRTIGRWKKAHPEFAAGLDAGKEIALEDVVRSLHEMAVGYEHVVQKPMVVGRRVEIVTYVERIPPSVTAQIFTLKNRDPKNWRDKQEIEVSGDFAAELAAARKRVAG